MPAIINLSIAALGLVMLVIQIVGTCACKSNVYIVVSGVSVVLTGLAVANLILYVSQYDYVFPSNIGKLINVCNLRICLLAI